MRYCTKQQREDNLAQRGSLSAPLLNTDGHANEEGGVRGGNELDLIFMGGHLFKLYTDNWKVLFND